MSPYLHQFHLSESDLKFIKFCLSDKLSKSWLQTFDKSNWDVNRQHLATVVLGDNDGQDTLLIEVFKLARGSSSVSYRQKQEDISVWENEGGFMVGSIH